MIIDGRAYTEGIIKDRKTKERYDDDNALVTDLSPEQIEMVNSWIDINIRPRKTECRKTSSYGMKHVLERDTGIYMTNNQFKDAMLLKGYYPINENEHNWRYKIRFSKNLPDAIYVGEEGRRLVYFKDEFKKNPLEFKEPFIAGNADKFRQYDTNKTDEENSKKIVEYVTGSEEIIFLNKGKFLDIPISYNARYIDKMLPYVKVGNLYWPDKKCNYIIGLLDKIRPRKRGLYSTDFLVGMITMKTNNYLCGFELTKVM